MAWRGAHVCEPANLSLKQGQLVVEQDERIVRLPIEDIAFVILDTLQVRLSGSLLSALVEAGIMIVQCNGRHMPCGVTLPFASYWRQGEMVRLQTESSAPFRKRCWQALVRRKIYNQAAILDRSHGMGLHPLSEKLRLMMGQVHSGDPHNMEAQAARLYWSALFEDFRRGDSSDLRNAALNYGYAVLRAALARTLVAAGFVPALGLFHSSVTNAFNLADDLLEPFRPFVDRAVMSFCSKGLADKELSLEFRRELANIPFCSVEMSGETTSLLNAVSACVNSLSRAFRSSDSSLLLLPELSQGSGQ